MSRIYRIGSAGVNRRRYRPENAHLGLSDCRKFTSAAGNSNFRNQNRKNSLNQKFSKNQYKN